MTTAIENAVAGLRSFIKANASATPILDAQVVREPNEGPRRNAPYIGVFPLSSEPIVRGSERSLSGATVTTTPKQIHRVTLRLTAYGAGAIQWLSSIALKLDDFGKARELEALGVGVEGWTKQQLPTFLDTSFEKREVYDFFVIAPETLTAGEAPTAPALVSTETTISLDNGALPLLTFTVEAP